MPESYSIEDLKRRIRWYINLRWFIIIGLSITGIVPQYLQQGLNIQVAQNVLLAASALGANGIFWLVNNSKSRNINTFQWLAAVQIVFDILLMTSVIYYNGGVESPTPTLYVIPIVMAGALLGRRAIYITGLTCAVLYALSLALDLTGSLVPQNILAPQLHESDYVVQAIFFVPAMLLTVTVLSDFVSRLIRERSELNARLEIVSAQKAEEEALLKTLGSALVAIDAKGLITLVNDAFENLTGWKKDEVIGSEYDKVLPLLNESGHRIKAKDRPLIRILNSKTTSGVQHISNFYFAKKNGTMFPFVATMAPIIMGQKIVGATSVFEDATSTKKIQQLKSNFVALASHQLKTPLGEIRGFADNMLGGITGPINDQQKEYLQQIEEIALRCSKMVADLLDINILEQGNLKLNVQPTKISEIIEKVLKVHQRRLDQKQAKFKLIEADKNLKVTADADKLMEVIGNVVDNAINHTRSGSTITVETKWDSKYGLILVKDQGEGIDMSKLNSIFRKGSVLSATPAPQSSSGLGLYLAKEMLLLQGGQISVLSSTKEGTTMCIKIPLEAK